MFDLIYKKFAISFSAFFIVFLVCSCANGSSSSDSSGYSPDTDAEICENVYRIGSSTTNKTFTNVNGKEIYLVNVNIGNTTLYPNTIRSCTGASARTALDSQSFSEVSDLADSPKETGWTDKIVDFNPPSEAFGYSSSSRTAFEISKSTNYTVNGTKTKSLRVNLSADDSTTLKSATLYYSSDNCYVWIVDDYYNATVSANKVNATVATNIGQKFDKIYPLVRRIAGNESNLFINSSGNFSTMGAASDTGEKVNIVLFDIEGDYTSGQSGGVLGYFSPTDYFDSKYSGFLDSNEGKYFYIDSYFANTHIDDIYSTLAHEFQHMINFGVKYLEPSYKSGRIVSYYSTWYTEMLSMMCEDLMQSYLGIADSASPKSRFSLLNEGYYALGIGTWSDSDELNLLAYAQCYGLGAFLMRNYGGNNLYNKIATNDSIDMTSILEATGLASVQDLLEQYIQSFIYSSGSYKTFNKAVTGTISQSDGSLSYSYPLTAVNIWGYSWTSDGTTYSGPAVFTSDSIANIPARGFFIRNIGECSSDSVNLAFGTSNNSNERLYVLIK